MVLALMTTLLRLDLSAGRSHGGGRDPVGDGSQHGFDAESHDPAHGAGVEAHTDDTPEYERDAPERTEEMARRDDPRT